MHFAVCYFIFPVKMQLPDLAFQEYPLYHSLFLKNELENGLIGTPEPSSVNWQIDTNISSQQREVLV